MNGSDYIEWDALERILYYDDYATLLKMSQNSPVLREMLFAELWPLLALKDLLDAEEHWKFSDFFMDDAMAIKNCLEWFEDSPCISCTSCFT
jgi:beta-xylosidase